MVFNQPDARWNLQSLSDSVHKRTRWMELLGILLILYGVLCLLFVGAASVASILWIGGLLLVAGVTQIATTVAYWSRGRGGFSLGLILGCLCAISGILCLMYPAKGLQVVTFILAIYFISSGIVRMTILAGERFPGWGWGIVAAGAEILLGLLILASYPGASLVLLGTLLGLQLIFAGSSALTTGIAVRKLLQPVTEPSHSRPATRFQH